MQGECTNIYYSFISNPRHLVPFAVVATTLLYTLYSSETFIWKDFPENQQGSVEYVSSTDSDRFSEQHLATGQCPIVKLDPFDPSMQPFIKDIPQFNCLERESHTLATYKGAAFQVEGGHYLVKQINLDGKHCCYKPVTPVGDEVIRIASGCKKITSNVTKIPSGIDVIEVVCRLPGKRHNQEKNIFYRDGFSIVSPKPKVEGRIKTFEEASEKPGNITEDDENLSVIMIGLDSMSQMHFLRKLPETTKYLTEVLSAVRLDRYNKIGENTLPNLLGSLTGRTFKEFQEECINDKAGIFNARLDNCSFIWKIFANEGYRTGFSEDQISISLFNLVFGFAFDNGPPTDYYWRPYSILMENHHGSKQSYCYGAQLSFETLMQNVKHMADVFKHKRYFKFTYSTRLGHDNFSTMAWADKPLYSTINHLNINGHLNNTALIIIGDHGLRGHDDVPQAMYENRQPAAYIVLPDWFRKKYSLAHQTLVENAKSVLTTPYDLHRTLLDFMDLGRLNGIPPFLRNPLFQPITQEMSNRGISLFEPIPESRSCSEAGIPMLWCTCYSNRKAISHTSSVALKGGEAIIKTMNAHVAKLPECAPIAFTGITSAYLVRVTDGKYKSCSRRNASDCLKSRHSIALQLAANAQPGNITVESVVVKLHNGEFHVPEEIVRTDWFQRKGSCVPRSLQPFCMCKNYLDELSFDQRLKANGFNWNADALDE